MKVGSGPWRVVGHGGSNANVGWRRDRDDAIAIILSSMPLARVRLLIFRLVLVSPVALIYCVGYVSILPHELHISGLLVHILLLIVTEESNGTFTAISLLVNSLISLLRIGVNISSI